MTATGNSASILTALPLAGLLGMLGQGVRALAGLKKMNEEATKRGASSTDLFIASRLVVSLMIGFLAGVAAGLLLGLNKLLAIDSSSLSLMVGIAALGYAGTDFIESFVPTIADPTTMVRQSQMTLLDPSQSNPLPLNAAALRPGLQSAINARYGVTFTSLVPNGFYSSDPDDLKVPRSIRTNNPGALNFTSWQKFRLGFVAITQPDNSRDRNITTIFRTPEHGVAAWYHLVARIYAFPNGRFTLNELAARYAGSDDVSAINAYVTGWSRWIKTPMEPTTQISIADSNALLTLAMAMFSHEAGVATPLHDEQITFAIGHERDDTLPA